ncbi:MAG: cob(I)yrinic acid a,c-diamide adenosyltransferase [Candidatus Omnitrophica bacterium]|nr:cob(I)yrinic acid a,c-diamide adenosyltransferase [Candidatus Omnitrophota bacterium]
MTKVDKAPRNHKTEGAYVKKGLILVHTGAGKGKSTAAFGTALRAVGRGWKVAVVQFIKGKWKTGEAEAAKKYFGKSMEFFPMGDGFTWETKNFKQDVQKAQEAWKRCVKFLHDKEHALVIFDEINYVLKYNFLDVKEVLRELKKKPPMKHVILTGGGVPEELIEIADLVTEMKCIKHPYQKGIKAQPGIEY